MSQLGLEAVVITQQNVEQILMSETIKIFFLSPELLKSDAVIRALVSVGKDFVIKCIDEAEIELDIFLIFLQSQKSY